MQIQIGFTRLTEVIFEMTNCETDDAFLEKLEALLQKMQIENKLSIK